MKHVLRVSAIILTIVSSLATTSPAQTTGPAGLTNGLVTWLQLEETGGTRAQDVSGNGKSGQFINGAYWHYWGKINRCVNLSGNQSLQIPLQWQPFAFTVAWWVYADGGTIRDYTQAIGANLDDPWQWGSFMFHASASGKMYVGTDHDTRLETIADREANSFVANKWQHFVFTFQRGEASLYKDGVRIAYRASGMSLPAPWKNLAIGSTVDSRLQAAGYYDDFRVYDRALSPDEVTQLVASTASVYTAPAKPSDDLDRNWSATRSYDGTGNVIGESKAFADGLGRGTQAQVKNQTTGHVLATQTVYSSGGKPVLSTLAAPVDNAAFSYKQNFITAGGAEYGPANFEGAKASNPDVPDYTGVGTLRYYYSSQNTLEPLTAATAYPFSLTEEYGGPLGGVKRAAGPGEAFRMGAGHEAKGREFPLLNDLDHYLSLRPQFVPGATRATTLRLKGEKAVSINADGKESISFSDADGKLLATCLSGSQYPGMTISAPINSVVGNRDELPQYQDLHVPAAGPVRLTVQGTGRLRIVNLLTDAVSSYAAPWPVITLQPGFYRVISEQDNQLVSYLARYGEFSYSYYDDAGRVVATVAPRGLTQGLTQENLVKNPSFESDGATQNPQFWQTDQNTGRFAYTETYGGAHSGSYHGTHFSGGSYYAFTHQLITGLPNGRYTLRAWVKGSGGQAKAYLLARNYGAGISYTSFPTTPNGALGEWSLLELQDLPVTNGQCDIGFESQANGGQFIYYDDVEFFRQPDTAAPQFVTRNTYSGAGTLLSTESTDEGRTEYVYAQDGRIRFSQSALQRQQQRFSYSNYDEVGRVVESGEYQMPSPAPQSIVLAQLEAENAQTNATVEVNLPTASNNSDIGNLTQVGRYVTFAVTTPRAGAYVLDFRYSSGVGNTVRSMSLYVNGTNQQQLQLPATGAWSTWATSTQVVNLGAGTSYIKVQMDAEDNGWINLDYLRVTDLTQGLAFENQLPKTVGYEAENASSSNPSVTSYPGYRGTGFIGDLTNQGTYVQFTVTVPVAGRYPVQVRYAAGLIDMERAMPVYVNGVYSKHASFAATNSWAIWATQIVDLDLRAGTNTIRFQHDGRPNEGWINLDYIDILENKLPTGSSVLYLLEDRTPSGGLDVARCSQRSQVWYDLPTQDSQLNGRSQEFVLGAVAKTSNGTNTTWYSYDELGRVTWMVQQLPGVGVKTVDYTYDFTGNVLEVAYQRGQPDAFYHHYEYDADKRLRSVYTSPDGVVANRTLHARYSYYLHGPLKRVEIADRLQGIDYAYTVQGWLKSINNSEKQLDPGQDSPLANGTLKDLFGMRLDYFDGDYRSRQLAAPSLTGTGLPAVAHYDGTVKANSWHTAAAATVHGYVYQYDEKGQLLQSDYGTLAGGSLFTPDNARRFEEGNLSYDTHGNILSLRRRDGAGFATDDFAYQYTANTNKLQAIKNQNGANVLSYDYDVNGQMTRESEVGKGNKYLRYDVTGKVTGVYRNADFTGPIATYAYNDRGFRSSKVAYNASGVAQNTTYYVTDVQGNVLSNYEQPTGQSLQQTEIPLYGSSRVGTLTRLDDSSLDARYELNDQLGNARVIFHKPKSIKLQAFMEPGQATEEEKVFANVAATRTYSPYAYGGSYVSRINPSQGITQGPALAKPLAVERGDTLTFSAYTLALLASRPASTKLAPVLITGAAVGASTVRPPVELETPSSHRGSWLRRIGAGIAITRFAKAAQQQSLATTGGATSLRYILRDTDGTIVEDRTVSSSTIDGAWQQLRTGIRVTKAGTIEMMLTSTLPQEVLFDNVEVDHTGSAIVQEQHQYAFGSPLTGLNYVVGNKRYRHGYQGQYAEKDEETGYDSFELRLYNSRIGRWISYDPAGQFNSPYVGLGNNPISGVDPDGGFSLGLAEGLPKFRHVGQGLRTTANVARIGLQVGVGAARAGGIGSAQQPGMSKQYLQNRQNGSLPNIDKAADRTLRKFGYQPDKDGLLNLDEANYWYRNGGGKPLTVDASKLDLTNVKVSDFKGGNSLPVQTLYWPTFEGRVYGHITLELVDKHKGIVRIKNDLYNFEMHDYPENNGFIDGVSNIGTDIKVFSRNRFTQMGEKVAGNGKPFTIIFKNTTKISLQ